VITLADLQGRATISVPEAGQLLGIGRDAAYDAAARGEIPVLRLGRTRRVPVPQLLALLGALPETSEAGIPAQEPATASNVHALVTRNLESSHGSTDPAA
jgi:excisionase family DNA binding protein